MEIALEENSFTSLDQIIAYGIRSEMMEDVFKFIVASVPKMLGQMQIRTEYSPSFNNTMTV